MLSHAFNTNKQESVVLSIEACLEMMSYYWAALVQSKASANHLTACDLNFAAIFIVWLMVELKCEFSQKH